jgi:uncharacterized protein
MRHIDNVDAAGLLAETTQLFKLGAQSIHGPSHWQAVMRDGMALADALGTDHSFVAVFALVHDCRRENEYRDPDHGERAAEVVGRLNGRFFDFSEERLERLRYAVTFHDRGKVSDDLDVSVCWAADRIELQRVGIQPARWGFCALTWPIASQMIRD